MKNSFDTNFDMNDGILENKGKWTSQDKTKYRTTKQWKDFRLKLIEERSKRCECCGVTYSGKRLKAIQVHHFDPDNYNDLNPVKFACLCSKCHDAVESLAVRLESKKQTLLFKEKWLALYGSFLPYSVRHHLKEGI